MRIQLRWTGLLAILLLVGLTGCNPRYAVTDLGTLGGEGWTKAADINPSGHVTGLSRINDTVQHAFLWNGGGAMVDLGSTSPDAFSAGAGINETGVVVGVTTPALGETTTAQVWTGADLVPLATLGGTEAVATSICDAGFIAGAADLPGDAGFHAVHWAGWSAKPTDLGTLGGPWSFAQKISQSGQTVGWSLLTAADVPGGPKASIAQLLASQKARGAEKRVGSFFFPARAHAFSWTGLEPMRDLGTLGGNGSMALGINTSGVIVGTSYIAGDVVRHAVMWDASGGIHDLGGLGGTDAVAVGINDDGIVVGMALTPGGDKHAFLYEDGVMTDLNTLMDLSGFGWTLEEGMAINGDGLIAGSGTHNNQSRAFVLTPN